jgi:hypothetical protein
MAFVIHDAQSGLGARVALLGKRTQKPKRGLVIGFLICGIAGFRLIRARGGEGLCHNPGDRLLDRAVEAGD